MFILSCAHVSREFSHGLLFWKDLSEAPQVGLEGPSAPVPNPRKSRGMKQPGEVGRCRVNRVWQRCTPPQLCHLINIRGFAFVTFVVDWDRVGGGLIKGPNKALIMG